MRFEFPRHTSWLIGLLLITAFGCRDGGPGVIDILSVTPTGVIGEEGDEVTFSALTDSSTPSSLIYSWTFGAGTNPATSTDATPSVRLVTAGTYSGTLTVSDGSDTGTAPFSFEIEPGVITVTSITPTAPAGLPAGTINFEAITEGTATSAEWTFDGGTDIATSSDLTPLVHLGEVGTYSGTVTLSNENHTADPFPFEFRIDPPVAPNWRVTELGPASLALGFTTPVNPWTCAFIWKNRPGVFFNRADGVYLALATTEDPLDAGDWNISQVAENHRLTGTRIVAALADTLHVLHFGPTATLNPAQGFGLHISSTSTADPTGPEDWITGEVDALAKWQWPSLLGVEGVGLVVAYANSDSPASAFGPDRPIVGTTSDFAPEGSGDWDLYDLELFEGPVQNMEHLYVSGGKLYLLFDGYTTDGPQRVVAHSEVLFPSTLSDWEAVLEIGLAAETSESQISTPAGFAILGQRLCSVDSFTSGGTMNHYFLASDSLTPDLSTPWVPGGAIGASLPQEALGYTAAISSGRGVALVRDGDSQQPILWRQLTADPSAFTAGSWIATSIATEGGSLASMAVFPDGRLFTVWIEPNALTLVAAISDGPY